MFSRTLKTCMNLVEFQCLRNDKLLSTFSNHIIDFVAKFRKND